MLLADIKEVIKASPAIQIQNRITHLQRRAWNVLLANAYNELRDKEIHTVSVSELATKLGFERVREKEIEDLEEAFRARRANLLRQAIQADPELVERASARIDNNFVRRRIEECDTAMEAYQAYPAAKAYIDDIIATDFCHELLAPVIETYRDEKAKILAK